VVNVIDFDLNLLVVFDALLTDQNVTRAARRVGLSQPAFSNALSRLRTRTGDRLFDRTRDGMIPTPRALAMADPVRSALAHVEKALAPPLPRAVPERCVTVYANGYAQCLLLPRVLQSLSRGSPRVGMDVRASIESSAGHRGLTIDWTSQSLKSMASVDVVSDILVCVARRGSAGTELERPTVERDSPAPSADQDFVGALCLAAQSDMVVAVPRRLAEWFAPRLGLRLLPSDKKSTQVALQVSWRTRDTQDYALMAVKSAVVEAGRWLQGNAK
jgi:DNA-binding transcriptional LysR family regulator